MRYPYDVSPVSILDISSNTCLVMKPTFPPDSDTSVGGCSWLNNDLKYRSTTKIIDDRVKASQLDSKQRWVLAIK